MTNEEDVEKKKGSVIFSLVSYVSINCIRFTGIISAQSTPTNNGVQSIYFVREGQGDCNISTHSRPKVAATWAFLLPETRRSFNTQPRGGGCLTWADVRSGLGWFQHTAARRRLRRNTSSKARCSKCFNTQPPEGGCSNMSGQIYGQAYVSTHSHPKVAAAHLYLRLLFFLFQHTATRRWLLPT